MRILVSELTLEQLNQAVIQTEKSLNHFNGETDLLKNGVYILEREKITTTPGRRGTIGENGVFNAPEGWTAWSIHDEDDESEGSTLLEAGLRCYIHQVHGAFIEIL